MPDRSRLAVRALYAAGLCCLAVGHVVGDEPDPTRSVHVEQVEDA